MTKLQNAARNGDLELVKGLLDKGLRPSMVSTDGRLALHEAARSGRMSVISYLLELETEEQNHTSRTR